MSQQLVTRTTPAERHNEKSQSMADSHTRLVPRETSVGATSARLQSTRDVGGSDPAGGESGPLLATSRTFVATGSRVSVDGALIGPFKGSHDGRERAELIATRLGRLSGEAVVEWDARSGSWCVAIGGEVAFQVTRADATAAGFPTSVAAARSWARTVTGKEATVVEDKQKMTSTERRSLEAQKAIAMGVFAKPDGTVIAHGIRIGPFTGEYEGRPRAELIAEKLAALPSSALRSATAAGSQVLIGDTNIRVLDGDASAQGEKSVKDCVTKTAELLKGTWKKGAYAEAGRQVMPANHSAGFLYEFGKMVLEGPGRGPAVPSEPGQVTVVSLRGVNMAGVYNPVIKANDDVIIAMAIRSDGSPIALKFSGTVDPGGTSGGVTQVGDATSRFGYKTDSGNRHLNGMPLWTPKNGGIAGRDGGPLRHFDESGGGREHGQTDTLIHMGTNAEQSRGCTVLADGGSYSKNKESLTALAKQGLDELDARYRNMSAEELDIEIAARWSDDPKLARRLTSLLELRRLEAVTMADQAKDTWNRQRYAQSLGGAEKADAATTNLSSAGNYKAFLSMVHRDPDIEFDYTIVDGSKLPTWKP